MNKNKKKLEFSKVLLIQESMLIWITTLLCIGLAFFCIINGFTSSLPWISSIIVSAWGAYGVSQVFYYKKSIVENSKNGIKYEAVLKELEAAYNNQQSTVELYPEEENGIGQNIDIDYGI